METEVIKNNKVFYHKIGTNQSFDKIIYEDKTNPGYSHNIELYGDNDQYAILFTKKSTDDFALISVGNLIQSQNLTKSINFKPLIKDWIGKFDIVKTDKDKFYFLTNYKAPNFRLVLMNIDKFKYEYID